MPKRKKPKVKRSSAQGSSGKYPVSMTNGPQVTVTDTTINITK